MLLVSINSTDDTSSTALNILQSTNGIPPQISSKVLMVYSTILNILYSTEQHLQYWTTSTVMHNIYSNEQPLQYYKTFPGLIRWRDNQFTILHHLYEFIITVGHLGNVTIHEFPIPNKLSTSSPGIQNTWWSLLW